MTTMVLKRQIITDADGNPVGVILPLSEYARVEKYLAQNDVLSTVDKLTLVEQASTNPLFMADLNDTMSAFAEVDAEWWEPTS